MHIQLGKYIAQLVCLDTPAWMQVQARQLEPRRIEAIDHTWCPMRPTVVASCHQLLLVHDKALYKSRLPRHAHLLWCLIVVHKRVQGRLDPCWEWWR